LPTISYPFVCQFLALRVRRDGLSSSQRLLRGSPKIEKLAFDQSNPAQYLIHYTHPVELAASSASLSPSTFPLQNPDSTAYIMPCLFWQRPRPKDPRDSPQITRSILPICNGRGSRAFRSRVICLLATFHVSLRPILPPPVSRFSQMPEKRARKRGGFGKYRLRGAPLPKSHR
jgi:hypothetical protein